MCPRASLFLFHTATTPANAQLRLLQCLGSMPWVIQLLLLGEGIIGKLKKRNRTDRDRQTERQLLLLAQPIRLVAPMTVICFFYGTKREMIVVNTLPCQLIQAEVEGYWTEALNTEDCQPNIISSLGNITPSLVLQ